MRQLDKLRLRLRSLFRAADADRDLARELRGHLEEEAALHRAAGMSDAEARRTAARAFGSTAPIEEGCRDTRRVRHLVNFLRDLRYALRAFGRQPGLFAAATLSIALGMGANLTMFSLGNSLLFADPSAERSGELVMIRMNNGSHVSHNAWQQLAQSDALAGIAGYRFDQSINWRIGEQSATSVPMFVTANFFDVVRVPMASGRGFSAAEARADLNPRLVVVSHRFWTRELNGAPDAVGRTLTINGQTYTIVGVLASGVRSVTGFAFAPDLYVPLSREVYPGLDRPQSGAAQLIGRLRGGQTAAQGRAAVSTVVAAMAAAAAPKPEFERVREFAPAGGFGRLNELPGVGSFFAVLSVVSGLVLVIACANVAGLLLARGLSRRKETAMRAALGASRGRLMQQVLAETTCVTVAGALGGAFLTLAAFAALSRVSLPIPIPIDLQLSLDWRVAAVAATLLLFSAATAGVAPALATTKSALLTSLKLDERRLFGRSLTMRNVLVGGQVAVSTVLLIGALLFVQSVRRAASVSPGFDADSVLVAQISFVEGRQGSSGRPAVEAIIERVRALPGVTSAAFSRDVPLTSFSGSRSGREVAIDGGTPMQMSFNLSRVGPGYFTTMGIRLLQGRDFSSADRASGVVIVNEEFARRYFAGESPIGRHLTGFTPNTRDEIIGMVSNSKYHSLVETADPAMYTPVLAAATPSRLVHVLVKSAGAPESWVPAVRAAVMDVDGTAAVTLTSMRDATAFAEIPSRMGSAVLGVLGVLGATLAMVGLFGLVSFSVSKRTPEIAIRMALGASRAGVLALVLKGVTALVVSGLLAGLAIAYLVTSPLSAFLVAGVSPTDPISFAGAAVVLLAAALAAVWGPARRATGVAPAAALKID